MAKSVNKELIAAKIYGMETLIEKAKEATDKEISRYKSAIKMLQGLCPHEDIKYVPDASGNNDSYHFCIHCKLEKKRKREFIDD